jgi:protein required for attachment to host cells
LRRLPFDVTDFRRSRPPIEETACRRGCRDANRFSPHRINREKQSASGSEMPMRPGTHFVANALDSRGFTALGRRPGQTGSSHMNGRRLKHGVWVLVADGGKALFLRNEGDAQYPNLRVMREMQEENPPTREQGTDRPGRLSDPSGPRSAVEDTDWHRIAKERFADEIAERLYRMAHRGDFERILLVAPPQILGEMRKKLHKEVGARVIGEIPKTLTGHAVSDIEKVLTAEWAA